jgi:serine/threonine protein kinase
MIMEYIEGGNLRKYLQKDYRNLTFESKILRLIDLAQGLKDIHQKGLVHHDFHSGNILSGKEKCFITDLGLSKPASSKLEGGNILGVMPYMAPEALHKGEYSQKSDIYSFGIIATEILTGISPFPNVPHNYSLAVQICQGKRPKLDGEVKIPQLLKDLIKKC